VPAPGGPPPGHKKKKKRKSKFVKIRFHSAYDPGSAPRAKACRGSLSLTLKRGKHRLQRRSARFDRRCRYRTTFKVRRSRIGNAKRLTVFVHFGGNRYLGSAADSFSVKVPAS
jgi:hypothetical protein